MLRVIIGAFATLAAAIALVRVRVPGGVKAGSLGWMSEEWLSEHRTSRPS